MFIICISHAIYMTIYPFQNKNELRNEIRLGRRNIPDVSYQGLDPREKFCGIYTVMLYGWPNFQTVMWIRIRFRSDPHLGLWNRIRIQGYKMKGKAEFNQHMGFFCKKLYFSSLKIKKVASL